jgi:AcrR family transcriptional regulator
MCNKEQQIILKALELFRTYGIKSVSMDDIAMHMTISKKTLYQFLKDKKELVRKSIEYNFNDNKSKFDDLITPELNAIEQMLTMIQFFNNIQSTHSPTMIFDLQKYYPEEFQFLAQNKRKALTIFYANNFEKGIKEGLYRKNMDTSVISRIIIFLTEMIIDNEQFTIEELCSPSFVNELYLYHLHGIVSEKGIKFLNKVENDIK